MNIFRTGGTILVLAALLLAPHTRAAAQSDGNAMSDHEFARYVGRMNLVEMREAHVALEHSKNETVQRYAKMMLDDHAAAAADLAKVAGIGTASSPAALSTQQTAEAAALDSISAPAFDRKYMEMQVTEHYKELAIVQSEVERGSDPVKGFAVEYLASVQRHLRMAQAVVANADRYLR